MTEQYLIAAILLAMCTAVPGAEHKELKAFPAAEPGLVRFVIVLPHKDRSEEGDFKVELVAGKELMTDGVNQVRLDARITPQPLVGWGYTFYEVSGSSNMMSTLMAVPDGQPQVRRFVAGEPLQVRYNSRLPIVVYAPDGYEIRYRIWSASAEYQAADPG